MSAEVVRNLTDERHPTQFEALPAIPLLGQVEVIGVREGGLVECYVPTDLIDHEEVPVKEVWASAIAEQMREIAANEGGSGQQSPIQVGWIEGESKFKIIDGFHRDAALLLNNQEKIYSTVRGTDWNTLYDSRIFTAKDHVHVRFSRVVQWIREVWEYSGLSDQMTVEQAVLLYRFDTDGSKLGLEPNAVTEAKTWVDRKQHQWGMAAMTIHSHLKVAENVDPQLVHSTREKRSGHALEAPTQTMLKILSDNLPGQSNFELQNIVVATAINNNLKGPQVTALAMNLRGKDIETAQAFVDSVDWENWQPAYSESTSRKMRRAFDPRYKGASVLNNASTDVSRIIERVKQSIAKGDEVSDEMKANLVETMQKIQGLYGELGSLALELVHLASGEPADDHTKSEIARLAGSSKTSRTEQAEAVSVKPPLRRTTTYLSNQAIFAINHDRREPQVRNRNITMELPTFGRFTKEDWYALEPYQRFALALDHERITGGSFISTRELLKEVIQVAGLEPETGAGLTREVVTQVVKPLVTSLSRPASPVKIIDFARTSNKLTITDDGREYLSAVVKKTRLEIDEVRFQQYENPEGLSQPDDAQAA